MIGNEHASCDEGVIRNADTSAACRPAIQRKTQALGLVFFGGVNPQQSDAGGQGSTSFAIAVYIAAGCAIAGGLVAFTTIRPATTGSERL